MSRMWQELWPQKQPLPGNILIYWLYKPDSLKQAPHQSLAHSRKTLAELISTGTWLLLCGPCTSCLTETVLEGSRNFKQEF